MAPLNYKSIKDNINFRLFCQVIITIEVLTYFRKVFQKVRMDCSFESFLLIHCNSELLSKRFSFIGSESTFYL